MEGMSFYSTIMQCREGPSHSVWMLSATEIQPSSPSVSFICPCVTAQLQCASLFLWEVSLGFQHVGEDFCLAPHLSVAYLNHARSCHPSHCPPISFSLSAVKCSKYHSFILFYPASLCFSNKGTFLSLSPRRWLAGNSGICCLNFSQIFQKMNTDCLESRPQPHLTPQHCVIKKIKGRHAGRFVRLIGEILFLLSGFLTSTFSATLIMK